MERRVAFALVGLFSLVMIAGIISFVLWSHEKQEQGRARVNYAIHFDQAVNGLSVGSSVRYLGVDVGQVQHIGLDISSVPPFVQIVVGIDQNVRITEGDVATIKPSGITGVSFVDLRHDSKNVTPLTSTAPGKLPIIRSELSDIDRLLDSSTDSAKHLNEVLEKIDRLFEERNTEHIAAILDNLSKATASFNGLLGDMQKSGLDRNISSAARESRKALDAFSQAMESGKDVANDVSDLSKSLRDNPSQILYPSSQQGVEIEP